MGKRDTADRNLAIMTAVSFGLAVLGFIYQLVW